MLGTLETTFHGQKTFRLVGGSLSWSETPYFHKGGPLRTDMRFVKNFTPPDFQAKYFTPLISLNFNSFSDKKHKEQVVLEKFTPLAKILHCRRQ